MLKVQQGRFDAVSLNVIHALLLEFALFGSISTHGGLRGRVDVALPCLSCDLCMFVIFGG